MTPLETAEHMLVADLGGASSPPSQWSTDYLGLHKPDWEWQHSDLFAELCEASDRSEHDAWDAVCRAYHALVLDLVEFRLTRDHELFVGFVHDIAREQEWSVETILYALEKPWKWSDEFVAWATERRLTW